MNRQQNWTFNGDSLPHESEIREDAKRPLDLLVMRSKLEPRGVPFARVHHNTGRALRRRGVQAEPDCKPGTWLVFGSADQEELRPSAGPMGGPGSSPVRA